ncbi:MAG: flagellar basal body rod protein FlgB [Candidatus Zixiibacteriota bacterium]
MDNKLTQFIFDKMAVPTFRKYLNLGSFRQKLISGNLANVATPGYESRDIDFQGEFNRLTAKSNHLAGTRTDVHHLPIGAHQERTPDVKEARIANGDMNSIDVDHEMAGMVQNQLAYSVAARLLQMKFAGLRNAIKSE